MRILFIVTHPGLSSYGPALRLLAERGHKVHLAFQRVKTAESRHRLDALSTELPAITFGQLPPRGRSNWSPLAGELRHTADYLRYLEPRYRDATKLRARAERKAPPAAVRLGRAAKRLGPAGVAALRRGVQALERCVPPAPGPDRYLAELDPDIVLITPMIELGSTQADWLRAAKRRGIRTGFPVFSWDNLTNKGLLRDVPDLVLVWNDLQAAEARELHGVPADQIRITGAPAFDHWFDWPPSRDRPEFCAEVGLRPDRPILLYLCSSGFIAPDEPAFVRGWIKRLRARGGLLAEAGILVRPHPLFGMPWVEAGLEGPQIAIWPRLGEDPSDEAGRRNYFDSIYHSAAVVGINTTAQIEAAIVGRPVHTLLSDEFRETQQGTLHFHYLQSEEYGPLYVGETFDEHAAQLEESLRDRPDDGRNERFLRRFVRPLGLDVVASEVVASAIEELGARPAPAPAQPPAAASLLRPALRPLAMRAADRARKRREDRPPKAWPARDLQRRVHKLARTSGPVVAGPWEGDSLGELLYWIPFLRWAQTATLGLRERLFVLRADACETWYAGIGARQVPAHMRESLGVDCTEEMWLDPRAVDEARAELAGQDPHRRIQRRLLEFAPLDPPPPPRGLELPPRFVAAVFAGLERPERLEAAVEEVEPVVRLERFDSETALAVLGRADAFLGPYGVNVYLAVLLGVPAIAVRAAEAGADELRLASTFLAESPFGSLELVEPDVAPELVAERIARVLRPAARSLAPAG
jgi:hypothetical protein